MNSNTFQLEIYGIIQDIIKLAIDLNISFVYVPKSKKYEADFLAKSVLSLVPNITGLNPI